MSVYLNGLIDLPWWGYVIVTLALTHITIASVTIYLHRAQAHRALDLHPAASHFFRFWLWFTTATVTKAWVSNPPQASRQCKRRKTRRQPANRRHQYHMAGRRTVSRRSRQNRHPGPLRPRHPG